MKHWVWVVVAMACAGLTRCVEIIDFDLSNVDQEVVIYGVLTDSQEAPHWIDVSLTRGFGDTITVISDAEVVVTDEQGLEMPYVWNQQTRRYEPSQDGFHGIPGQAYQVAVKLGDKTYRSRPERMPAQNIPEQLDFNFTRRSLTSSQGIEIEENVFEVYVQGEVSGTDPVYLRWEVEEVFIIQEVSLISSVFPFYSPRNCYIPKVYIPAELALFNSLSSRQYRKRLVIEPVDEEFKGFHAFGIFQYSITAEAHKFWSDIQEASDRTPTIFETPPGPVKGNLFNIEDDRDQALGYFMVAKVDTGAVGTTESDIPFFVPGEKPPGGCDLAISVQNDVPALCMQCLLDRGVPLACVDCITLPGSTRRRPAYLSKVKFPEDGP